MDIYRAYIYFLEYNKVKKFPPLQYLRLNQASTPADENVLLFFSNVLA